MLSQMVHEVLVAPLPRLQDPKLAAISETYRYRAALVELDMIYYSEKPLRATTR